MSTANTRRVALVTGTNFRTGIGQAIARALVHQGMLVCATYYQPGAAAHIPDDHPEDILKLLEELRQHGGEHLALPADLSDAQTPAALFAQVGAALGMVDVLVNNAAVSINDGIDALTPEHIDQHYAVNIRGMLLMCQQFYRQWRGERGGRIINMTSGQGAGPMPGELAYVATKGAVDALTVTLSAELMPHGITVNAVDPGITDTGWITPNLRAQFIASAPRGRVGTPDDAARLVAFLASEDAEWITGQIVRSRGGL